MMLKDVERIFEITKDNQYTKITVKNNKVTKVLVAKSGKIYLVFDSGNWQYYDSKEKIEGLIAKGVEILGKDNMILDPDCGLRRATKDVAFNKLKLMNSIKDEYS